MFNLNELLSHEDNITINPFFVNLQKALYFRQKNYRHLSYNNKLINMNEVVIFNNNEYQAIEEILDLEENNPINNPNKWIRLGYINNIRVINNNIAIKDAFFKNEEGYWNGKIYISLIHGNIYNPEQKPQNWKIKE